MPTLKQNFLKVLLEADAPAIPDEEKTFDAGEDEAALQQRLASAEMEPNALDIDSGPHNIGYEAEVSAAKGWIAEIDNFVKYLNSTESGSINHQINVIDRDKSVFKGIASRVSDKLARVSSDLAELKEIIAGFVISSDRKAKSIKFDDSFNIDELPLNEKSVEYLSRYGFEVLRIEENRKYPSVTMILEADDGNTILAEINESGLVNGENIDSYLNRLSQKYSLTTIDEDIVAEDVVMDESILKQIKDIDEKLASGWDNDLYLKRRDLLSKMEKPYIDVAKTLMKEED